MIDLARGGDARSAPVGIREVVVNDILAHANAEWPAECCGLLIGSRETIEVGYRARNRLASPTRYTIEPEDHFAAIRFARTRGLDVVGAYHSHPDSPPTPSLIDLAEAIPGGFLYVIAGPGDTSPDVRAWRLVAGNFVPVPLVTVK